MTYTSGEFQMGDKLWSSCRRGVAIYDNKLHVLNCSYQVGDKYLSHAYFDLHSLTKSDPGNKDQGLDMIDTDALKNSANWNGGIFRPGASGLASFDYATLISLVAGTTALWAFCGVALVTVGIEEGRESFDVTASKFNPAVVPSREESWDSYRLLDQNGGGLQNKLYFVSARAFGANQFLVAGTSSDGDYPSQSVFLGLYHLQDIDTKNKTWKAQSTRLLNINKDIRYFVDDELEPHPGLTYDGAGNDISIEWFLTVENDAPSYYLAVTFTPSGPKTDGTKRYWDGYCPTGFIRLPLADDKAANAGEILPGVWGSEPVSFHLKTYYEIRYETGLMRDPAGRLKSYDFPRHGNIGSRLYTTTEPPSLKNHFGLKDEGAPSFKYSDGKTTRASGVFYVFNQGRTTVEVEAAGDNSAKVRVPADNYPVLEFTAYGVRSCQLNHYGDIRVIKDTKKTKPKDANDPVYIIGGILDGPIPFPIENYAGTTVSNGTGVGDFTYGKADEQEQEISDDFSWRIGFETTGGITEGVGPAWDVSMQGGMGTVGKETKGTKLSRSLKISALISSQGAGKNPKAEPFSTVQLLAARFHITGYQFVDAAGQMINDALSNAEPMAPKLCTTLTTMVEGDQPVTSFETYYATPGKLESYTPEAINATMAKLGYKESDNYFGDIICKNAYSFGDNAYLLYGWSNDGTSGSKSEIFSSAYDEQNWSFDTKIYGGVSGGGGIDFFGIGEKFSAKFLAGAKFSRNRSAADITKSSWGLDISNNWGPLNNENLPDSIQQYGFRAYFLPVPQSPSTLPPEYWAAELIKYLPNEGIFSRAMVDPRSACWRIVFVVTDIGYRDPKKVSYHYSNALDRDSVYATKGDKH